IEEGGRAGTAGALASVAGLHTTFLGMNVDLLTDLVFAVLVSFQRRERAALTIAAHRRHVKVDFGVLQSDDNHQVIGYNEKPELSYDVSMGIYVYEPRVLK